MIQRCSSQASFVNTVSFEVTLPVRNSNLEEDLVKFSWTTFPHKREIPDHCMSSRKFRGRGRKCLCGCALILVLGSRRDHSLTVATVSSWSDSTRTESASSSLATFLARKRIQTNARQVKSGTSEFDCVHLHTYHASQNSMPFHRK